MVTPLTTKGRLLLVAFTVKDCAEEVCPSAGLPKLSARVDAQPAEGQVRVLRIMGCRGCWVKSKASVRSLAAASRAVNGGSPKRSSINFRTEDSSYCVCEI